jgi:hypothetical protein
MCYIAQGGPSADDIEAAVRTLSTAIPAYTMAYLADEQFGIDVNELRQLDGNSIARTILSVQ